MKNVSIRVCQWVLVFGFMLGAAPSVQAKDAELSTADSEWTVSAELLGQALLYSFQASYRAHKNIAINAGIGAFSSTSTAAGGSSNTVVLFPLSVSGLFGNNGHHFEVLGGGTVATGSFDSSGLDAAAYAALGMGYRYWPDDGGFHFRMTMYGFISSSSFIVWPGVTLGMAL